MLRGILAQLRADAGRLAVSLLVVLGAAALIGVFGGDGPFPAIVLLVPVVGCALVAGPAATAVVGTASVLVGMVELSAGELGSTAYVMRALSLVVVAALSTLASAVRTRHEAALEARERAVLLAEQRADAEAIVSAMLEHMPAITEAADLPTALRHACRVAREMFSSSSASYWQVEGDDAVLVARDPAGGLELGMRLPKSSFSTPAQTLGPSRTGWVRRDRLAEIREAVPALTRTGTSVGTSTPVRVGGLVVGFIGLGWDDDRNLPDAAWLTALDRFADQVAIAKTVVRRRMAQHEAESLGRRLQTGLLPVRLPVDGPVVVRSEYRPGTRHLLLGGDFLDVVRDPADDSIAFLVGDVAGHGPEQAALGTMLRAAWTGVASLPSTSIKEWVGVLDWVVRERRPNDDLFVTAVMGRVDVRRQTLEYVIAGHPPPLLLGCDPTPLPLGDLPLGVLPEAVATMQSVELPPGWTLLIVTDGLFEGRVYPGSVERIGYDGLVDLLRERGDDVRDPGFLPSLLADVEARNGGPLPDDAAALLLSERTAED